MARKKEEPFKSDLIRPHVPESDLDRQIRDISLSQLRRDDVRIALRKMITLNIVFLAVLVVMVGAMIVVFSMKETRQTIAMSPDGRIVTPVPLSQPFVNIRTVNQFADEALFMAFQLDFNNYRQQLTRAKPYFTENGFKDFEKSIATENWLQRVISNNEIMTAKSTNTWVIGRQAVGPDGRYFWDVQSPVTVEFIKGKSVRVESGIMTFRMVRVSNIDHPFGVGISQVIFRPVKS